MPMYNTIIIINNNEIKNNEISNNEISNNEKNNNTIEISSF